MASDSALILLKEQLRLATAARNELNESYLRSKPILDKTAKNLTPGSTLSVEERETLEALTSRFANSLRELIKLTAGGVDAQSVNSWIGASR